MSGARGPRPRVRRRRRRVRRLGERDAPGAGPGTAPDRRRHRRTRRRDRAGREQGHRQADRVDGVRGAAAELGPLPVLRRRRAGARGQVGGRVPGGPHLVRAPGADRGDRPGDAVELPADDDDLEDRAGPGRRQHRGAQAERHHTGELDPAGRAVPGVPAAGRAQHRLRRPRHRPPAGRAQDAADGLDHRVGARRHGGGRIGGRGPQEGAPRARRQGARHRLRRRRHREGGRRDRRGRLLQRRAGLHRRHPSARGAGRPQRLRGRHHRAGQGHPHRPARRRRRRSTAPSTTRTSSPE